MTPRATNGNDTRLKPDRPPSPRRIFRRPALVDLTGVDMGAYSPEQIACDGEHKRTSFYAGDFLADCMARKGYKVTRSDRGPRGPGI